MIMDHNREDALVWALKVANAGVPVSDVLADAALIREYMGGKLAPVEGAIATIQRLRDKLPRVLHLPPATGGLPTIWGDEVNLDEFLGDLIQDLRSPVVDAEVIEEPDWSEVSEFADQTAELEAAKADVLRLQSDLDEAREHLAKGALLAVLNKARMNPERTTVWCVQWAAEDLGVTM